MIIKKYIFILACFITAGYINAQEIEIGVSENQSLMLQNIDKHIYSSSNNSKANHSTEITLPFLDDFSYKSSYPDQRLWSDKDAYINNRYGKFPVSIGVATLDAIDEFGAIYKNQSYRPFIADHLSSNAIRLDSIFEPTARKLTASDSVYLSFYYQPKGYGRTPEEGDSLVLEFFNIDENDTLIEVSDTTVVPWLYDTTIIEGWNRVWSTEGIALDTFRKLHNQYFAQVMVPVINESKYFKKEFRFRFLNYASLLDPIPHDPTQQNNNDHWNIDYVYLNIDRSISDTLYRDITFSGDAPSFLKNYQSMPYWQYNADLITETKVGEFDILISNLDNQDFMINYKYHLERNGTVYGEQFDAGFIAVKPFEPFGYLYDQYAPDELNRPSVNQFFPVMTDETNFKIVHTVKSVAQTNVPQNDTLVYNQFFGNYYAYDDGTSEAGYGLTDYEHLAYKFSVNVMDTLRAVQIFFNKTPNDNNANYYFDLLVWNDRNTEPDSAIYAKKSQKPSISENLNQYSTYYVNDKYVVLYPNNVYYIGIHQLQTEILNIGVDKNNDAKENLQYTANGRWYQSLVDGALMIRPVFGDEIIPYEIESGGKTTEMSISIFPNPVNIGAQVFIEIDDGEQVLAESNVEVYNMMGKIVYRQQYSSGINLNSLASGVYVVRLFQNQEVFTSKIVISK